MKGALVKSLDDLSTNDMGRAGGKGSALAKMYQAGFPVPDGFVVFSEAFNGDRFSPEAQGIIRQNLTRLRERSKYTTFAARSSALCEDSEQASFAGEFETVLNLGSDEAVLSGILDVRKSLFADRVHVYSSAKDMQLDYEIAVVVQCMVSSDISGVLFTADPVKGSRLNMVGNFVYGLGESLVSGEADAYAFTLDTRNGTYCGPNDLRPYSRRLYKMGKKLEKLFGMPQDIEWAVSGGMLYVLQSRPVTTMVARNLKTGEMNDTLTGDYLWGNANFSEAVPDVMTPITCSAVMIFHTINPYRIMEDYTGIGNIYGHPYLNLSLLVSIYRTMGYSHEKALRLVADINGKLPENVEIPLIPLTKFELFKDLMVQTMWQEFLYKRFSKGIDSFIRDNYVKSLEIKQQIRMCESEKDLLDIWHRVLYPYYFHACWVLRTATEEFIRAVYNLRTKLSKLVGEESANDLMQFNRGTEMASLGPLVGLSKVAKGEMTADVYMQRYGHRSAYEFELSKPAPVEIPGWLDDKLTALSRDVLSVEDQLADQDQAFLSAWQHFTENHPKSAKRFSKYLHKVEDTSCRREAVRSAFIRVYGLIRMFALSAAKLTRLGDDVFFLGIEELCSVLDGDMTTVSYIPARRETYQKYCELPPLPAFIKGRFDAYQWVNDPERRTDIFDPALNDISEDKNTITGIAGAAGRVEGVVRVLRDLDESGTLQPGEILVTNKTNIGWTLLFTRAAAIVTDIGAPLSHAAIVARELGIPAVVGCSNATMRLRTGDRVMVDGGRGIVKII